VGRPEAVRRPARGAAAGIIRGRRTPKEGRGSLEWCLRRPCSGARDGSKPGRPDSARPDRPSRERSPQREDALDDKLRQILRDLGRSLAEAITDSSDVTDALRKLHEEGYSLFILLDRREAAGSEGFAEEAETAPSVVPAQSLVRRGEPVFRIHGADLSFLRSIGIDPTRRVKGRK